jgi:hypothetical protein
MVKFDVESTVDCGTCGEPAIRRTANLEYPNMGSCKVSFDTHSTCITGKDWLAAITRMDVFHKRLFGFMEQFKRLTEADRKLECGKIARFDFRTIHPDACSHREMVVIQAEVRFHFLDAVVETQPRPLKGIRLDSVLKELRPLIEAAALKLKKRFDEG